MNPRVIVRLAFGCLLTTPIPAAADPSTASLEQIGSGATARWTELGKRGEAHIACGSDCIEHGQPAGIVDETGKLTLLFVEEHDPRRHREIDVRDKLASLVAKRVSATGMLTTKDGCAALYVRGSNFGAAQ